MIEQLQTALNQGKYGDAEAIIATISANQANPTAQVPLLNLCLKHGFNDLSVTCFGRAAVDENLALQVLPLLNEPALKAQPELANALLYKACEVQPNNPKLTIALADTLLSQNHADKAQPMLEAALGSQPHPEYLVRLAEAYFRQGKLHDAKACVQLAISLGGETPQYLINLATVERSLGNLTESAALFTQVLAQTPDNALARINLSHLALLTGQFELGWREYDWRWRDPACNYQELPLPVWQGEEDHKLLLWGDQGIGDQIMFLSLLNRIKADVTLSVDPRLIPLLPDAQAVLAQDYQGDYSEFDSQLSLGSAAGLFIRDFDDFQPAGPYLGLRPALKNINSSATPTRVGFSWRGGSFQTAGETRCIDLQRWQPLFALDHLQWVNLQYDSTEQERQYLTELGVETPDFCLKNDFSSIVETLHGCHHYVGVDNTTAHLAGAIGTSTLLILAPVADWRWFTEPQHCYWYDCMKLSRTLDNTADKPWQHAVIEVLGTSD